MNLRLFPYWPVIAGLPFASLLLLLTATTAISQPILQKKAAIMWWQIEKNHYQPPVCDDAFSERVFNDIIGEIDPYKVYFTSQDFAALTAFKHAIDDEIRLKSWGLADALAKLLPKKYAYRDSVISSLLARPLNFTPLDQFDYNSTIPYPATTNEHIQRITSYVKWMVLNTLLEPYDSDSTLPSKIMLLKNEPEVRKKVLERHLKRISRIPKGADAFDEMIAHFYLTKIAEAVDPHTAYFPPLDKADFDEQLNSEQSLFGFTLEENEEGKFTITNVVPGSSAWNSGDVHTDDELVALKVASGNTIAMTAENALEVTKVLANDSILQISVTLRGADGTLKTVPLQKQVIRNEDNIVKGFVLEGVKKIGYIQLPSFYTTWSGPLQGTSCADDVAQEIVKLKAEKIEGLIVDLRYNGGGSLKEAVDLAGIFIDAGPICLMRHNDMKAQIYKDQNRGTIYDGPLAVMINGQSASASELVAGTLQDYNRAIIIGSSSFGKATAQNVYPLDTLAKEDQEETALSKELGYVKVTVGKLFRVTGKTAQLKGVVPHIGLPDAFEGQLDYTERGMPYALPSDTVMKTVYYTPLAPLQTATIAANCEKRVQQSTFYQQIRINSANTINFQKNVPLQIDAYIQWYRKSLEAEKQPQATKSQSFTIATSAFDSKAMKADPFWTEMNAYVTKELSNDVYVDETYRILLDFIHQSK